MKQLFIAWGLLTLIILLFADSSASNLWSFLDGGGGGSSSGGYYDNGYGRGWGGGAGGGFHK